MNKSEKLVLLAIGAYLLWTWLQSQQTAKDNAAGVDDNATYVTNQDGTVSAVNPASLYPGV
jgi:hypothetical protein